MDRATELETLVRGLKSHDNLSAGQERQLADYESELKRLRLERIRSVLTGAHAEGGTPIQDYAGAGERGPEVMFRGDPWDFPRQRVVGSLSPREDVRGRALTAIERSGMPDHPAARLTALIEAEADTDD